MTLPAVGRGPLVLPDGTPLDDVLLRGVRAVDQAVTLADVSLPDQPLVWVNDAFARITGYPASESVGRNCRFLQDRLPTEQQARRIRSLIRSGLAGTVVLPNRRRNGSVFVNELSLSPVTEPDGSVRFYLAVQRDVTARSTAESARDAAWREVTELGAQLQRHLVPHRLPPVPGLEFAVRHRPATRADGSRGEVSGDFHDLRVRPDGTVFAVIGDVSGRGPRAAATTVALRWAVRGAAGVASSPAHLLELVADAVHDGLDDRFGTVAVARFDPSTVTVALAGHPHLVHLPNRGRPRFVGRPGTLLGPFGTVEVHDEVVGFGPGDVLVLYTDGVTEALSPGREHLGETGLLAALDGLGDADPQTVADRVLDAVTRHVDDGPTDDLTLTAVRRVS
jgi:phosphoserine phosphatase RsbU/P